MLAPLTGTATTALLLIDLQRGVTEVAGPYSLGPERSEALIHNVQKHLAAAQAQGWHQVFIVNQWPAWRLLENWWFDNAFRVGSPWADLDPRLGDPEHLLVKSSADAFSNPALELLLAQQQVQRLLIVGLFAEACVRATVKTAVKKGYQVSVFADAVVTKRPADLSRALARLEQLGAEIIR